MEREKNDVLNKKEKIDEIYDNDKSLTQEEIYTYKPELRPGFKLEDIFDKRKKK